MNKHEILINWFKEQYPKCELLGFGICLSGIQLSWINESNKYDQQLWSNKFIDNLRKGKK